MITGLNTAVGLWRRNTLEKDRTRKLELENLQSTERDLKIQIVSLRYVQMYLLQLLSFLFNGQDVNV